MNVKVGNVSVPTKKYYKVGKALIDLDYLVCFEIERLVNFCIIDAHFTTGKTLTVLKDMTVEIAVDTLKGIEEELIEMWED